MSFPSRFFAVERLGGKFGPNPRWSNKDMDPVLPKDRTWTSLNYVAYWVSDALSPASWQLASSMIAIGLSWGQATAAIAVGHIIIALVITLNGTTGARLHVAFPVLNRSSFGFWFSYFSVVSRVVLAMFWFGIQTFTGSECVYQMLKAIWPSVANIPNRLPLDAKITTVGMMCYALYWIIQFPFLLISPQKIRYLFAVKAVIVPIAMLSMLIWAMVKAPPSVSLTPFTATVGGSTAAWAWLAALNSALGFYSTLSVNIPDFTRYAKSERAQFVQLAIIPVAFTLIGFSGIAVTSAGNVLYGEILWDPLRLIDRWDNRAAAFFASFSFLIAVLGTNVSANSLSAANDMTVLFPSFINIRRGQIICAFLGGWALCPWQILASAPGFLTFMSGYTVFIGPFAAIMVVDYWLVHKGNVNVPAMYDPRGIYRYWKGVNLRAFVAIVVSVTPNLPGLIHSINPTVDVGNASYLFNISWLFGFFTAAAVYWILSILFPATDTFMDKPVLAYENDQSVVQAVEEVSLNSGKDSAEKEKHGTGV